MNERMDPTFHSREEPSIDDTTIGHALADPVTNEELRNFSPVIWAKGVIAQQEERAASEISDHELLYRYKDYGKWVWDEKVCNSITNYLRTKGLQIFQ